jgi:hypothetical protein
MIHMTTETSATSQILSATGDAIAQLTDLMSAVDEEKINSSSI